MHVIGVDRLATLLVEQLLAGIEVHRPHARQRLDSDYMCRGSKGGNHRKVLEADHTRAGELNCVSEGVSRSHRLIETDDDL